MKINESVCNSLSNSFNQNEGQNSNFSLIYQKRINDLQQKANKYCSQYDALMNLLPIANNFSLFFMVEREIQNLENKLTRFDSKVNQMSNQEVEIDRQFWEKQLIQIKSVLENNQKQLNSIIKQVSQEEKNEKIKLKEREQVEKQDFQKVLDLKTQNYEKSVFCKLAEYRNNIEFQKKKQIKNDFKNTVKLIKIQIDQHFNPIIQELCDLEEQVQIARLVIPRKDLKKFHEFNYNRLLYQIMRINETLERYFLQLTTNQQKFQEQQKRRIIQMEKQIQDLSYEIKGSRQIYLHEIEIFRLRYCGQQDQSNFNYQNQNNYLVEKTIKKDLEQIQTKFIEIQYKFKQLQNYVSLK